MDFLSAMKREVADTLRRRTVARPQHMTAATVSRHSTHTKVPPVVSSAVLAVSVVPTAIGGESVPSGLREVTPISMLEPQQLPQPPTPLQLPEVNSPFVHAMAAEVSRNLTPADFSVSAPAAVFKTPLEELDCLLEDKCTSDIASTDLVSFYLDNLHDYELGKSLPIVKGRLKAHIDFWVSISAPQWVLSTIRSGYVIPFSVLPTGILLPNNKSARDNSSFVSQAISDLLHLGLIVEVFVPPTVINPLSVSFNSQGSPRLILDLRHVNKCVPKPKFRMEDWKTFLNYVVPDGFMFKFDMKSGYHHVDICNTHQQYLGFQWPLHSNLNRYFCFTVLPFGLSSSPYLFTKFFRPLVSHWRSQGFHLVLYGISCESDFQIARSVSSAVRNDLINAGVVPNLQKSSWDPVQTIEWLGLSWNLAECSISIPQSRPDNLLAALDNFKSSFTVRLTPLYRFDCR